MIYRVLIVTHVGFESEYLPLFVIFNRELDTTKIIRLSYELIIHEYCNMNSRKVCFLGIGLYKPYVSTVLSKNNVFFYLYKARIS